MEKNNKNMTQVEIEHQDKRSESILKKVNLWQEFKYVKHLTCQRNGCGCSLVPKKQRAKVVLQCPQCKNVQSYVPRAVLHSQLKILNPVTGKFVDDVTELKGKSNVKPTVTSTEK